MPTVRPPQGPQGSNTRASADRLARTLVQSMRHEADIRTSRIVKHSTVGTVVSVDPVQIQTELQFYDGVILTDKDVLFLAGTALELGETVLLVRTITDQIVAFPIGPLGYMGAPGQGGPTDSTTTPSAGGGSTVTSSDPSPSGPNADLVIAKALSYAGKVAESGDNRGTQIDAWEANYGMSGEPWCGIFADQMYREAGVDDQDIGHPSTFVMWQRASAIPGCLQSGPVKGCFCIHGNFDGAAKMYIPDDGHHVTLYIEGPMNAARTIGGNESDAVRDQHHDLTPLAGTGRDKDGLSWVFAVPVAITENAITPTTAPSGTGADSGTYHRRTSGGKQPKIIWRPIKFTQVRKQMMADYSHRHYYPDPYAEDDTWKLVPKAICMHYTAGESDDAAWNTFDDEGGAGNPNAGGETPNTSAHFIVAADGTIYQLVDLAVRARHVYGVNNVSIGIEHVGTGAAEILARTAQMSASYALVNWLMRAYGIWIADVFGHNESPTFHYTRDNITTATHSDWTASEMVTYKVGL